MYSNVSYWESRFHFSELCQELKIHFHSCLNPKKAIYWIKDNTLLLQEPTCQPFYRCEPQFRDHSTLVEKNDMFPLIFALNRFPQTAFSIFHLLQNHKVLLQMEILLTLCCCTEVYFVAWYLDERFQLPHANNKALKHSHVLFSKYFSSLYTFDLRNSEVKLDWEQNRSY